MDFKVKNKIAKREKIFRIFCTPKSQISLESMTIYFWALLIIAIAFISLWYFGVLSPSKRLPDRCTIGPYIECRQYLIAETDTGEGVLRLKLKNNFAETLTVTQWELTTENQQPIVCTGEPFAGVWEDGATIDVEFRGCNIQAAGLTLGEKAKVNVRMVYYPAQGSSTFSKAVEGEIFASVNPTDILISEGSGMLQCSVTTSCIDTVTEDSVVVFGMSTAVDAVVEAAAQSSYNYKACCTSTSAVLSNDCGSPDAVPLKLSSSSEAHVEKNTFNNFPNLACLSADTGDISCLYKNAPCDADETCLATISADTDAHVSDCIGTTFSNYVCCKMV